MHIRLNPDEAFVLEMQEALRANDWYCPCTPYKTEDTKCMCKEFKQQIEDPNFEGYCHCLLYYKSK